MTTAYSYQKYIEYIDEETSNNNMLYLIKKLGITKIQPTKKKYNGITRAGLFSYYGFIGNKKVKIYSCFTNGQAILRKQMNTFDFSCKFPTILGICGNVLVDEWINGKRLDEYKHIKNSPHVLKVLAFIHEMKNIDITSLKYDSFDYLQYLLIRIKESTDSSNIHIYKKWEDYDLTTNIALCHNDLFDDNMIMNENGIYVIDNEMLGISSGWFLTCKNSFLPKHNIHINNYCSDNKLIDDGWILRKAGSKILKERR